MIKYPAGIKAISGYEGKCNYSKNELFIDTIILLNNNPINICVEIKK
jgi:hypothetical protein